MHFKELFDPFSSLIKHVCFDGWLLSFFNLIFYFIFVLFKNFSLIFLEHLEFFPLGFDSVEKALRNTFLLNSKEFHFFFSELMSLSSSQKGPPVLLDNDNSLFFFIFNLSGSVFLEFISEFIELETSDNALPSSFKFLNDSDCSFHIAIKSDSVMGGFDLFTDAELLNNFVDCEVSSIFGVMDESRERDFECLWCEFHIHENFINVDIIGLDNVCMGGVAYNILFNFTHADHGVIEHLFHEDSLLGMDHLIVGFFEFAVGIEVSEVECSVVLEPFQI